jgi:DNA polymerase-3 subunit delta
MAKETQFDRTKKDIIKIQKDIAEGKFAPVYLFHGEEEYFIDQLTDLIVKNAIGDADRDFNQTVFYGADAAAADVINACKRFPMMSDRQIVVLKEAQNMKDKNLDELVYYVDKPLSSTVLLIVHKHGKIDGRRKLSASIAKKGVVFESKKLYDNEIPSFIKDYAESRKIGIDSRAMQLLADYLGTNISKLVNELEKLAITLPENSRQITTALIEQNIGISKDYNNFELLNAISRRDILKANRIIKYFEQNPKSNPLPPTLATLFNFFASIMSFHYEKDKSQSNFMQTFGIRTPYDPRMREYNEAMKFYTAGRTIGIISLLRECDARSKGFGNSSLTDGMLLKELIYKIMH